MASVVIRVDVAVEADVCRDLADRVCTKISHGIERNAANWCSKGACDRERIWNNEYCQDSRGSRRAREEGVMYQWVISCSSSRNGVPHLFVIPYPIEQFLKTLSQVPIPSRGKFTGVRTSGSYGHSASKLTEHGLMRCATEHGILYVL